jgi:hypothetical protein
MRTAFEAVSMGEAFVTLDSLKILFEDMDLQPTPSDEQLEELMLTCGKHSDDEYVSFELFARAVALLIEINADKLTTSSQNEGQGHHLEMVQGE